MLVMGMRGVLAVVEAGAGWGPTQRRAAAGGLRVAAAALLPLTVLQQRHLVQQRGGLMNGCVVQVSHTAAVTHTDAETPDETDDGHTACTTPEHSPAVQLFNEKKKTQRDHHGNDTVCISVSVPHTPAGRCVYSEC